ncbi:MAG: hypothetical protein Q9180_009119, partial [Flavoplaca navasiana]
CSPPNKLIPPTSPHGLGEPRNQHATSQIDNARALEALLRTKFTDTELFAWYEKSVHELYYQAYCLAQVWAKKAEQVYHNEQGITETSFMRFGYWEPGRNGLMADKRMFFGLKKLEAAYNETRGYDFEVAKVVSLSLISPVDLLQPRGSGLCESAVPKRLYDMDFPGHYIQKISTISLTIPCIAFDSQVPNGFQSSEPQRLPRVEQPWLGSRFGTINVPIKAIAVSNGQNDAGVFELNFKDERFLPISIWGLELPNEYYKTITDILLQIRSTLRTSTI